MDETGDHVHDTPGKTRQDRIHELEKLLAFPSPDNRLVINAHKSDHVQFQWQNQKEIDTTYRPPNQSLTVYGGDKTTKTKLDDFIASLRLLPMVIPISPLLAMIKYTSNRPWAYRWTSSIQLLWELASVRLYIQVEYGTNQLRRGDARKKAFDKVTARYTNKFDKLQQLLDLRLEQHVYLPMARDNMTTYNDPRATLYMRMFAKCLYEYTYLLIHLQEVTIYQYMRIASPADAPIHKRHVATLLTPHVTHAPIHAMTEHEHEQAAAWDPRQVQNGELMATHVVDMQNWFQTKQSWTLTKSLSNTGSIHDPATHIDHTRVPGAWQTGPNYRGLVPYTILWDYCMLLDANSVLGDLSKGAPCPADEIKELRAILMHREHLRKKQQAYAKPGQFSVQDTT